MKPNNFLIKNKISADQTYSFSGRIIVKRNFGKVFFFDLLKNNEIINCITFDKCKFALGDTIRIRGKLTKNKNDKIRFLVDSYILISKTNYKFPSQYYCITPKNRNDKNHILLNILSEKNRNAVFLNAKLITSLHQNLIKKKYFCTANKIMLEQSDALKCKSFEIKMENSNNLFMRTAIEYEIKKYLNVGFEKVYEIGKCFRNEGEDHSHMNEFTMLEMYNTNLDWIRLKDEILDMIQTIINEIIEQNDYRITAANFKFFDLVENFKKKNQIKNTQQLIEFLTKKKILKTEIRDKTKMQLDNLLFEKIICANLKNWNVISHFPAEISTLCKASKIIGYAKRIQIFYNDMEIVEIYQEKNNIFETENIDNKTLKNVLSIGYNKCAGAGIGIERLASVINFIAFDRKQKIKQFVL